MGVTLKISKPPNREYFTSAETVCGEVELTACRTSIISSITVHLEGRLHTAVRQQLSCQDASFRKSERLLFSNQQQLLSHLEQVVGARTGSVVSRTVVLPFALDFPALVEDCHESAEGEKPGLTVLPPSIETRSEDLRMSVVYTVRVLVRRRGSLHFNSMTKRHIAFRPLSATEACVANHTALMKTVNFLSTAMLGVKGPATEVERDLPAYSPTVLFEVAIPPCKTIFPGENIRLGLAFVIPDELRRLFATIWINAIQIRLRIATTATINSKKEVFLQHAECYAVKGSMPLTLPDSSSRIEIPSELWEHHNYPNILPSFHVAGAQREHQLQITVEFAWCSKSNMHTVTNRNDVVVESDAQLPSEAPPPYASRSHV